MARLRQKGEFCNGLIESLKHSSESWDLDIGHSAAMFSSLPYERYSSCTTHSAF